MSVTNGPNLGLMINALTGDSFPIDFRKLLRAIDVLLQGAVIDQTHTAPPGSPANGDRYIVAASPTGAWTGHAKSIAVWTTDNPGTPGGLWEFYAPKSGWDVWSLADAALYVYTGSAWAAAGGGGGGGGMSNPMTTLGDIIAGGAAGAPGRLAIGSSGQILSVVSGGPGWTTPSGGGTLNGDTDVDLTSPANNDVLTYESSSSLWKNKPPTGGGGGGIARSTNVVILPCFDGSRTSNYGASGGFSHQSKIGSRLLLLNPTTWKFAIHNHANGGTIGAGVIYRTLKDSMTIVDVTAITWGGSSGVVGLVAGELFTDSIALPLDMTHDYWVTIWFDPAGGACSTDVGVSPSSFSGVPPVEGVSGGLQSGDNTTLTAGGTVPVPLTTTNGYETILSAVIALT